MSCEVFNAGVPGDNSRAILARLEKDALSRNPSLCIVMAGTNDSLNSAALLPPEEFSSNISEILSRLSCSGSKIILMTPPPFHEPYLLARHPASAYGEEGPGASLAKVVAALRRISGSSGIPLVDMHKIFSSIGDVGETQSSLIRNPANSGSADGVHPTAEGYRVIAAALFQCIRERGLPAKRTVCLGDSITFGVDVAGMGTLDGESYPARLSKLLNS